MVISIIRCAAPILIAVAIAGVGRAGAPIAAAAPASAERRAVVGVAPSAHRVMPGGIVTASIVISQVANLYGADTRLSFDPAVLAVLDADTNAGGVQIVPGPLLSTQGSGMVFLNQAVNATGSITYVSFLLNPAVPFTGTGVLAFVRFQALAPGASAITFSYIELSTNAGQNLPFVSEPGLIVVGLTPRAVFPIVVR